jgi:hypothetical protein
VKKQIMPIVKVPFMLINEENGYRIIRRKWESFDNYNHDFYYVEGVLPLIGNGWHSEDLQNWFVDMGLDSLVPHDDEANMQMAINAVCRTIEKQIHFEPDCVMSLDEALKKIEEFAQIVQRAQEPIRQAWIPWQVFLSDNQRYKRHYFF